MSRKRREIRQNPDRHAGLLMNRESKYPIGIIDKAGHTIFLNPLKRMIKNKPYANDEYEMETKRMLREALMKQQALKKEVENEGSANPN